MAGPPLVSVVTPVWNGERFVQSALDSISAQTFTDFELLVLDDGSTDGTPAILARHARADARMRVYRQENQGIGPSRNRLQSLARGEFIAVLDADDAAWPDRLARQVEFLKRHQEVAAVGGAVVRISGAGRWIDAQTFPETDAAIRASILERNPFNHSAVMMRRQACERVGHYRALLAPAEDYDLFLRLAEHYALANLPEPVLWGRLHGASTTTRQLRQQILHTLVARASARARRDAGRDPLDGLTRLSPGVVRELGITEDALAARAQRMCVRYAKLALRGGDEERAIRLLEQATAQASSPRERRTHGATLRWARIRNEWKEGRRVTALRQSARLAAHPSLAARQIWRDLRYELLRVSRAGLRRSPLPPRPPVD